jgi:hypothetical protein
VYGDYLEKRIISTIYGGGGRAFLSLCSRELSLIIRKGLVMYGKRRLRRKRESVKLILKRGTP